MVAGVLIAAAFDAESVVELENVGIEVAVRPELTEDDLPNVLPGFKVLVVSGLPVTARAIEAAKDLALIVSAGSGTRGIDVEAASARGVFVVDCPGKSAAAVAELTFALMLALDRRIVEAVADVKAARWDPECCLDAQGLKGRVLGLVGFGTVARQVAERARAFEMQVRTYARSLTEEDAKARGVKRATSLLQLIRDSDVVSLHLHLTPETRGLFGQRLVGAMRPGTLLVNTAHPELVDAAALLDAVVSGRVKYGVDLAAPGLEGQSDPAHDQLLRTDGVYATPHLGGTTLQAKAAIADETVQVIRRFIATREATQAVNMLLAPPAVGTLVVRLLDRVGVLASVLEALKRANVNIETMENVIFNGGHAACARLRVSSWPGDRLLAELRGIEHVIHVEVV